MASAAAFTYKGPTQLCINNQWVDAVSGKKFKTINPATGDVIAEVAEADKADVDLAVKAARVAFQTWRQVSGSERSRLMYKLAELIAARADEFTAIEVADNGKPVGHAVIDHSLVVDCMRYYAGFASKIQGKTIQGLNGQFAMTLHEPIGVVAAIIPWNFPLLMWAWKMGPALAAGCTVVLKPAEQTPLSALWVQQLAIEAGFPPGVINTLPGYGPTAGAGLSEHMNVDKVAFTGSTDIGRIIMRAAASSNLKSVTLELGGKSPLIVFPDADLDLAIKICEFGLFFNQGQCCCASSRIYVHESVHDAFVAKITERVIQRKVGDPTNKDTEQGAQVDQEQFDKILGYIKSGKESGATLKCGGERHGDKGFFIQPTVFTEVKDDMKIAQEEIFGPVMSILKFSSTEDVIMRANNSIYGLAAGLITKDLNTALQVSQSLRAGTVWVNCWDAFDAAVPFGGFKSSGIGRELGEYALANFTQVKAINIALPPLTHPIEVEAKY